MTMMLLTKANRKSLPKIGETDKNPDTKTGDKTVHVKWFTPDSNWTWYCLEFDGVDLCYGLVDGFEAEFGYWSLNEIANVRGPLGLKIERDRHFRPKPIREVKACPSWARA